jgi:hypothetical protein
VEREAGVTRPGVLDGRLLSRELSRQCVGGMAASIYVEVNLAPEGRGSMMPCAGCSGRHRVLIFAGKPLCLGVWQPA